MARKKKINKPFLAIMIVLLIASFWVIKPFFSMFFLALVFAVLFDSFYDRLRKKLGNEMVASIITSVVILFFIILPVILIVLAALYQALNIIQSLQNSIGQVPIDEAVQSEYIAGMLEGSGEYVQGLLDKQGVDTNEALISLAKSLGNIIQNNVIPAISWGVNAGLDVVFFFFVLIYMFPVKDDMLEFFSDISPVGKDLHGRFVKRFDAVVKGTIKGTVLTGVFQGVLGAGMLAFLGFPSPMFWGLMMMLASFIPMGSTIVWLPIAIYLLLTGSVFTGIIFLTWGALVISSVDNVVRAKVLQGGDAGLPELVTLLSVVGGIQLFGFWGFIYGPVIFALAMTALGIYRENKNG